MFSFLGLIFIRNWIWIAEFFVCLFRMLFHNKKNSNLDLQITCTDIELKIDFT